MFFSASSTPAVGPVCMTYNAPSDQFRFDWRIAKGTAPGAVTITFSVKNADGTTNATKLTSVMLTK